MIESDMYTPRLELQNQCWDLLCPLTLHSSWPDGEGPGKDSEALQRDRATQETAQVTRQLHGAECLRFTSCSAHRHPTVM